METVKDVMYELLRRHGTTVEESIEVIEIAKTHALLAPSRSIWEQDASGYPPGVLTTIFLSVKDVAFEYLTERNPLAWYKANFGKDDPADAPEVIIEQEKAQPMFPNRRSVAMIGAGLGIHAIMMQGAALAGIEGARKAQTITPRKMVDSEASQEAPTVLIGQPSIEELRQRIAAKPHKTRADHRREARLHSKRLQYMHHQAVEENKKR
jgi:hypothetical protein